MTQYVSEFEIDGRPDMRILVLGPHDPPINDTTLTLGVGLVATRAQIEHYQSHTPTLPLYLPPFPVEEPH